jgi:hypothetical protein
VLYFSLTSSSFFLSLTKTRQVEVQTVSIKHCLIFFMAPSSGSYFYCGYYYTHML